PSDSALARFGSKRSPHYLRRRCRAIARACTPRCQRNWALGPSRAETHSKSVPQFFKRYTETAFTGLHSLAARTGLPGQRYKRLIPHMGYRLEMDATEGYWVGDEIR